MDFSKLRIAQTLGMRGGEYQYRVHAVVWSNALIKRLNKELGQACIQDTRTGRLFIIDEGGTMIDHLYIIKEN